MIECTTRTYAQDDAVETKAILPYLVPEKKGLRSLHAMRSSVRAIDLSRKVASQTARTAGVHPRGRAADVFILHQTRAIRSPPPSPACALTPCTLLGQAFPPTRTCKE